MAMELTTAPTAVSGHHSDADTPPASTPTNSKPAAGFLAYANGSLKRHYPRDPATKELPEVEVIIYRECLRNHAASIGGHALDGCCEFMPPAPANFNPSDPTSLRCAACGCHRNFHRRDPDDPTPLHRHTPLPPPFLSPVPTHVTLPAFQRPTTPATAPAMNGGGRKRFRTKFSEDQKQRLRDFSDKFGWKIQKIDKGVVAEFCNEVGVGREVLKVWMHNHKNSNNIGIGSSVNGGNGGGVHIESVHHHDPNSSGDGSSSSSGSQ